MFFTEETSESHASVFGESGDESYFDFRIAMKPEAKWFAYHTCLPHFVCPEHLDHP
jgi:hypothetical protein